MRRSCIVVMLIFMLSVLLVPSLSAQDKTDIQLGKKWTMGPTITIPPLRLQESMRDNAKLDVVFTASVGGGLSFKYVNTDPLTDEETVVFSFSPFTILFTGDTTEDLDKIDLSYAMTVGFFNDLVMAGFGYNFGDNVYRNDAGQEKELSRVFLLLGFGVTFGG